MDADCLIKLTKAGLKGLVADKYEVFIPLAVKREVVDAGKAKVCPDAVIVEKNLAARKLSLSDTSDAFRMEIPLCLLFFRQPNMMQLQRMTPS